MWHIACDRTYNENPIIFQPQGVVPVKKILKLLSCFVKRHNPDRDGKREHNVIGGGYFQTGAGIA